MQTTENLGLRKPAENDLYSVDDLNYNADVIDLEIQAIKEASDPEALENHKGDKNNPHGVTKEQIGLGNVPNVTTNDQTPIYTVPSEASELESGEKMSVAFGKIAKAVKNLISHIKDATIHVTSTEKNTWNGKADASHKHTKSEITDFPSTMTPSAHNQAASTITAGTLAGKVQANASAMATLTNAQLRDSVILDSDPGEGASVYNPGTIVWTK